MAWTEQLVHCIDFEGSVGSGVVEFGVVSLRGGRIETVRTERCAPTGAISAADASVHGLVAGELAGWQPFSAHWAYFAGLRETGALAAHFAGVEHALLKAVWPYPRPSRDFLRPGALVTDWGPWVDTARVFAETRSGSAPSLRLEAVIGALGLQEALDRAAEALCPEDRRRYHAALYDALAASHILLAVAGTRTLAELLVMSAANPAKRTALIQDELF